MDIQINISIDDPYDGNCIIIHIRDVSAENIAAHGPNGAHAYDYRFSAKSDDPADWLSEALDSAEDSIKNGYHIFKSQA